MPLLSKNTVVTIQYPPTLTILLERISSFSKLSDQDILSLSDTIMTYILDCVTDDYPVFTISQDIVTEIFDRWHVNTDQSLIDFVTYDTVSNMLFNTVISDIYTLLSQWSDSSKSNLFMLLDMFHDSRIDLMIIDDTNMNIQTTNF